TIGGVRLNYGTHYSITHNRVLGILTVTILDVVWPFATQGGKWLSLKLTFQIAGNAEGPIMNGGDIYYNDIKGGEDEEEVSRSEFSKSSDNLVYIPGQPVKYTITETLPSNIGERFEIKIYDEYEQDKMDYDPAKTELWIGGTLLTQNAHYSVQNDATNGILTFTILYQAFPSYFYNLGGASVVLKLSFNTDPGIHSAITNKASIAYDGKKVHEDEVILEIAYKPGDVNGDGLINMQDVLLIYQHVRGRVLLTGPGLAAADVNGKDSVTMQDVLLVYHFFRGIIHSFN
ncbi:MAG: dockerin type I domain-containing protein, partial [Clostridiales bacterium]|nr:dockerin type I domain-containing protein [Clostridiales bacterium]